MIRSTTYRGSIDDTENSIATSELSPEDWIGEIVQIPHPASGHMGSSMGEIVDTTTVTKKRLRPPSFKHDPYEMGEDAYEEYECTVLKIRNLLTGGIHQTNQNGNPQAAFVADGESYSVFGIQHKNGAGEWVCRTLNRSGSLWGHNQFAMEAERQRYTGHEETRIIERSVTYQRDNGADPKDTTAYTLTETTKPIEIDCNLND